MRYYRYVQTSYTERCRQCYVDQYCWPLNCKGALETYSQCDTAPL